jgi:hypothetical protein
MITMQKDFILIPEAILSLSSMTLVLPEPLSRLSWGIFTKILEKVAFVDI